MIKESNPLVTVAMPIYNAGQYLRPAVLSIVKQTFENWELYIIDDGSTDNALSYIADIQDSRIKIIKDGLNKGLAARLNEIIDLAEGDYFARMDHDDIAYPDRFLKQIKMLEEHQYIDLLATRAVKITMNDQPFGYLPFALTHQEITSAPWRGFYMPHPTWMGKLHWFKKHYYAKPGPYLCEDQELLLRTYRESNFACLPDICLAYRVRDKTSLRKLFKIRVQLLKLQIVHFKIKKSFKSLCCSFIYFFVKLGKDFLMRMLSLIRSPHRRIGLNHDDITKFNLVVNMEKRN
jgi:glycosyltransferase involved in cell wall biosynthesis